MVEVGDAKGRRGFGEGGEQEGLEEQLLFVQKGRGQERNPGITEGLGMGGDLKSDPVPTGLIPSAKGWLLNSRAHQGFLLPSHSSWNLLRYPNLAFYSIFSPHSPINLEAELPFPRPHRQDFHPRDPP